MKLFKKKPKEEKQSFASWVKPPTLKRPAAKGFIGLTLDEAKHRLTLYPSIYILDLSSINRGTCVLGSGNTLRVSVHEGVIEQASYS